MNFSQLFTKPIALSVITIATLTGATMAASHAAKVHDGAVGARHAQMQMISYHTGVLGSMAKGEVDFDAAIAQSAAANLAHLAAMSPAALWTPGSEQGAAEGSRAKPEIWSDADGFAAKFKVLEDGSKAMMQVADLDALRAGMGAIGGSCKGCHQEYRGPKN